MASTLTDSEIDEIIRQAQEAAVSQGQPDSDRKMDRALEMINFTKEVLEAELESIQEDIESKLAYLMKNSAIKVEIDRRTRATKVAMASVAISLSSLTFGIRCIANPVMRDALPWAFGLSATSLLFSYIYCKRIWPYSKRESENQTVEIYVEPVDNAARGMQEPADIYVEPVEYAARRMIEPAYVEPVEYAARRMIEPAYVEPVENAATGIQEAAVVSAEPVIEEPSELVSDVETSKKPKEEVQRRVVSV